MNLSICMIAKNEQENLKKLLPRLKNFTNKSAELIIVDTGSTDNTISIAKKYTDKVFSYEWNDNFAEARNFSISKASNDWIMVLDADEFPAFYPSEVEKIINSMETKDYNSCLFFIKFLHKNGTFTLDRQIRLFKKSDFLYEEKIFNKLKGKQKLASSNLTIENTNTTTDEDEDEISWN
jgi:glycosyltransferase involved in cell wall biosynthesis